MHCRQDNAASQSPAAERQHGEPRNWGNARVPFIEWFRIQQCCGSGCIESGFESRVLITKNWRRKNVLFLKSKIAIYLSLVLHKGFASFSWSLQTSKENIRHFKKWTLLHFSIFVGHFCPPGSGSIPDTQHELLSDSFFTFLESLFIYIFFF